MTRSKNWLSLFTLFYLLEAIMTTGVNLMALLRLAAKLYPNRMAITSDREQLSYSQLWEQAENLAISLHLDYSINKQHKVAIICRNHGAAIKTLFAVSRLGAHGFLLNPEMSASQLLALEERLTFDLIVYDEHTALLFQNSALNHKSLPAYHLTDNSIERMSGQVRPHPIRLSKVTGGNIVVMTSGTTGQPKSASRKPSLFQFLPPFLAVRAQIHLNQYQSLYVATPICHGYGLAWLLIGIALGNEIYLTERFEAERACSWIAQHNIQVMTVVPLMLQRMLNYDAASLSSLQCIISGSSKLNPTLAQQTLQQLGPKLFNLYGTSEAGFSIMATPTILSQKPESIGRPIQGVETKRVNDMGQIVGANKIGRLLIRAGWSINASDWLETGDLAYQDDEGDIFLCGRVDDMIISGGVNVYPIELENVLAQHPEIEAVAVFGIPDEEFGQRLKAMVIKKPHSTLDSVTLLAWLKPRVARYQLPAVITFHDEFPYTSLGKLDRKSLTSSFPKP